ncbi:ABC transporter ATP-binding protein [Nesterenkonia sp. DZ6]|uniref:ABC transporter ATP-binding protein n=1 Tax=Nesterenkonia sp. DZ6 TaxID=2901229 RepID=UPI001F4D09B8|nr:ABC transporter ATP-binding protein [Nesterenkonia sp. DZ6]MCH8560034.1 ABC transporter ATP-binding protein [Nesterenkonia sp. DZ6]
MAEDLNVRIRHQVLDVDLTLPLDACAPITGVFGPSGAGKTTLLRCIAGLAHPGAGSRVALGGEVWQGERRAVPVRRRGIGYLFQDHALFPHLSVAANVAYGIPKMPRSLREERVRTALQNARAGHLLDRDTTSLSGGEAQRVALARALASAPKLLLLDEPFSALDAPTRDQLRGELREILLATGTPALLVTHDRSEAWALADRVLSLADGGVQQIGSVEEVFNRPSTTSAARAVGVENIIRGEITRRSGENIEVRAGELVLVTRNPEGLEVGQSAAVCVRAENISLTAEAPASAKAPNRFTAQVAEIRERGSLHQIRLQTDPVITAYALGSGSRSAMRPGARVSVEVPIEDCHTIRTVHTERVDRLER